MICLTRTPTRRAAAIAVTLLRLSTYGTATRKLCLRDRRHVIRRSYHQSGATGAHTARIRRLCRRTTDLLNRRFENVGEFGYAYTPLSALTSKTLDFASAASKDKALLDFFTYNTAGVREGIVNLNTRNGPVLASIINGALLHDLGWRQQYAKPVSFPSNALTAAQAIVQETTTLPQWRWSRVKPSRCCSAGRGSGRSAAWSSRQPRTKQSRRSRARWQR